MHSRRPGEPRPFDSFLTGDPTQPCYLGNFTQTGARNAIGGAPFGGAQPEASGRPAEQPGHAYLPPLYGHADGRHAPGVYGGVPNNLYKARPSSGLIGEVGPSSSSTVGNYAAIGFHEPTQQQVVAKLRLGGSNGVSGQSAPSQLALVGRNASGSEHAPYYGPRAVGQIPAIGQYGSGSSASGLQTFGSTPTLGSGAYGSRLSGSGKVGSGPPIGQVGPVLPGQRGHDVPPVPGLHRSATSVPSPFVPASTSHPITGIHHPIPSHPEKSGSAESVPRMQSGSTSGGLSHMESISNLGSVSQMGSIGLPSVAHSTMPHSRGMNSLPKKVKAVCSSGGHFVKLSGGGFEYQGGETRLIAIPNFCRFIELSESLERIAGNAANLSSASSEQSPSIKYQLPLEPNVYVDLVDDEDAQLMFDEWQEYQGSAARLSGAKLHLFVDWHRRQPLSEESLQKDRLPALGGSGESLEIAAHSHSQERAPSQGSAEGRSAQNSADAAEAPSSRSHFNYGDIAQRMEVIQPRDVSLAKFLGSGGYGEVYLGKWHHSEAAIKCLNPSLFYTEGQVSEVAIGELIREANLLGSLRHPNVVWVYGVVLPKVTPSPASDGSSGSEGDEPEAVGGGAAEGQRSKPGVPGTVRPPAIVTEFMSQGSLKGALQRKADIVQGALMRVLIAMDAAKGMEYLHSKKIVHFDLKSANLLLGYRDRRAICKVADFGLSKQKRETYVTGVSSQRGTLPWIAPEIIKSPGTVTEKVDVYSFGVVLWELWTGKEPYDGLNYHALLHQMTTSDAVVRPALPGSTDWDPDVGPEPAPGYRALMERCWADSPAGRPSFSSIVKVLKDMATSLRPLKKPRPPSSAATSSTARARESSQPQSAASRPEPVTRPEAPPPPPSEPLRPPAPEVPASPAASDPDGAEAAAATQPAISAFVAEAVKHTPAVRKLDEGLQ